MHLLSRLTPESLRGKRVLLRLDLNVPVSDGGTVRATDADKITKSVPTIRFLKEAGARVVIISHIGRDPKETLRPVAEFLEGLEPVAFVPSLLGDDVRNAVSGLAPGGCVMLENLRSVPGEEANDESFARELASYGDLYVNDGFAVSHRAHASVVGVPRYLPAYAGLQMEQEVAHLSKALHPESPSLVVIGGAKFETKLPVIRKFLELADHVLVGGALANNFYRGEGYETGSSLLDKDADIRAMVRHPKLLLPRTVIVEDERGREEKPLSEVASGDKIADAAPVAFDAMTEVFLGARFILWNGPLGNYENGFTQGSETVARLMQRAGQSGAETVAGGGDSVALIEGLGLADDFGFLSTGGGAMLEFLANGTLPGIEALDGATEIGSSG